MITDAGAIIDVPLVVTEFVDGVVITTSTVYVRSRARVQDVPWFQPDEVVEQALDMPVDELLDGQGDDEAASSVDETAEPARLPTRSGRGLTRQRRCR